MIVKYNTNVEEKMRNHFNGLNEKEQRHYAAIESIKLAHGGITYISSVLNISRRTIFTAIKELDETITLSGRIRKIGGGRKKILAIIPEIEKIFTRFMEKYTAGSPMNENIWTHLKLKEISDLISSENEGLEISPYIVKQLLEKNEYKYRTMQKNLVMSESENRNAQFVKIEDLKSEYEKSNNPIISIDVKKKN